MEAHVYNGCRMHCLKLWVVSRLWRIQMLKCKPQELIIFIVTFFKYFSLGHCFLVLLGKGNEEEGLFPFPTFHNKSACQP